MVSQNLRAQATVLLPAPYLEEGGFFDVPPRIRISAEEFQLCLYVSMVPPAFTLLYMGNFKKLQVQKILAVADTEVFGKLLHLVIPDGVHPGQVGSEHIDLGGLFHSFDQAEGFVHGLARTVDAVHPPNHQPEFLHLFRRGLADGIGTAEHPGQNTHAVWEHHDALGTHFPERMGEFLLVQLVDVVHGERISGMAVHLTVFAVFNAVSIWLKSWPSITSTWKPKALSFSSMG